MSYKNFNWIPLRVTAIIQAPLLMGTVFLLNSNETSTILDILNDISSIKLLLLVLLINALHFRLGFAEILEDYVHTESTLFFCKMILNLAVINIAMIACNFFAIM